MSIIKFPGPPDAKAGPSIRERLDYYQDTLSCLGVDPGAVRSHAQLDAILAKADAEAEAMLARLPPNHPLNQVIDSIDGFLEHKDEARARKELDIALNRSAIRLVSADSDDADSEADTSPGRPGSDPRP